MTTHTYVLRNPHDWVYVGTTSGDLTTRILSHNGLTETGRPKADPFSGGARFTRQGARPWRIVHFETDPGFTTAREQEWLGTLARTGTLPFLDFTPAKWGPKQHPGHRKRRIVTQHASRETPKA